MSEKYNEIEGEESLHKHLTNKEFIKLMKNISKQLIKESQEKMKIKIKKDIFEILESKRITDNSDYISIPIKEWKRLKMNVRRKPKNN